MKMSKTIIAACVLASHAGSAPASAGDPAYDRAVKAVQSRVAAIDALGDFSPGRAIVLVKTGEPAIVSVRGATRAEGGRPLDMNTPLYIASMTKAFVGLLAVRLDSEGILPLETTVGEVFPGMRVEGVDLNQVTMRKLLSHQAGLRAGPLNLRTAYTDLVPSEDYTQIINAAGEANGEAFRYDNFGYLLYSAALEERTSRSWRAWIDDLVFDPLGMDHSSARTSDFAEVGHLHMRYGDGLGHFDPKPDPIMHAAGGLVISAADMARWLKANAGEESGIPPEDIAAAQAVQVALEADQPPVRCTGYTFGWRQCEGFGLTFLEHGGGYTGMRSQMAVVPGNGVGFAAMFNSDSMTGGLSARLMLVFLAAYAGEEDDLPPANAFAADYAQQVAELGANRREGRAKLRADPKWAGWNWEPQTAELVPLTGAYAHPALGILEIALAGDSLVGTLNGTRLSLEPAAEGLFAAILSTDHELEEMRFVNGTDAKVEAVEYLGERFTRLPA